MVSLLKIPIRGGLRICIRSYHAISQLDILLPTLRLRVFARDINRKLVTHCPQL